MSADPTLGGFLPVFEPEDANVGTPNPDDEHQRLAALAGADVAALPDGDAVDRWVSRRIPGGGS